jgi:hypothetical protein
MTRLQPTEDDEFQQGIWWVPIAKIEMHAATPKQCAAEIKRLRALLAQALATKEPPHEADI